MTNLYAISRMLDAIGNEVSMARTKLESETERYVIQTECFVDKGKLEKRELKKGQSSKSFKESLKLQAKFGKKPKKGKIHQYELTVTINPSDYGLKEEEVCEFKEVFMLFDKDEDGVISKNELAVIMKSLGQRPSDKEMQELIKEADINGNGTIEFNEFLQLMSRQMSTMCNEEQLKEAFRVFDRNDVGFLTSKEFRYIMTNLGDKLTNSEVDEMMKEADINGDGKINYHEFVAILMLRK